MSNKEIQMTSELRVAVQTIKTAILQSQARAVKGEIRNNCPVLWCGKIYFREYTQPKMGIWCN